jgi:hypothetical protein
MRRPPPELIYTLLDKASAAFIDHYNHEWLIERLGYRTPT